MVRPNITVSAFLQWFRALKASSGNLFGFYLAVAGGIAVHTHPLIAGVTLTAAAYCLMHKSHRPEVARRSYAVSRNRIQVRGRMMPG